MSEEVRRLTADLVAIDSVNPSLVPGGAGESEIAAFIEGWAAGQDLESMRFEATPGRPSVVVRAPGSGGGRTLLLCGHVDTVTVEGMSIAPHEPRVDGDRLYGRGAYDMKAGVAAALVACARAGRAGLRGDVLVACVADEEHASLGVQEVLGAVTADAAIVTEPTELEVAVAHKGFVWIEVDVPGRAAHGSRHWLGEDAIVKAGPLLTGIGELDASLGGRERIHPLLGRGSVHASLIAGGEELSSYPARCTVGLERRTLPGESAAGAEAEIAALLPNGATQRTLLVREPFEVDRGEEVVRLVLEASGSPIGGASYWADAAFIASAGIPTVMFGPAGEGAHGAEEWVSIASTARVTDVLTEVAARFCA